MHASSRGLRAALGLGALALAVVGATRTATPADAQSDNTFAWNGDMAAGTTLRVMTVSGTVNVTASSGRGARVRGEKRRSRDGRGNLEHVEFQMRRVGSDVVVCALYRGYSTCDQNGMNTRNKPRDWGNNVSANFTVELPRGVHVRASSGNGNVAVAGATANVGATSGNGDVRVGAGAAIVKATSGNGEVVVEPARGEVEARSGNGTIRVSTASGPVSASTGNGRIEVRMDRAPGSEPMTFSSGNGDITVTLPEGIDADIEATSGSGGFDSDFPIQMQGRMNRHHVRGTIGRGGRRIRITTGNGDIALRRS